MAELESHVNIFVIFGAVLESNDVGVAESTADLDFGVGLYSCFLVLEGGGNG